MPRIPRFGGCGTLRIVPFSVRTFQIWGRFAGRQGVRSEIAQLETPAGGRRLEFPVADMGLGHMGLADVPGEDMIRGLAHVPGHAVIVAFDMPTHLGGEDRATTREAGRRKHSGIPGSTLRVYGKGHRPPPRKTRRTGQRASRVGGGVVGATTSRGPARAAATATDIGIRRHRLGELRRCLGPLLGRGLRLGLRLGLG
jgi:hypothetical protein